MSIPLSSVIRQTHDRAGSASLSGCAAAGNLTRATSLTYCPRSR